MANPRVFPTLREAIHATATSGRLPMKALASELDWSPSELSMRTTLGGESARPFPANDDQDRLVRLQRVTADVSILATMADLLGYEIVEKRDRTPERVAALVAEVQALNRRVEQLVLPTMPGPGRRK